MAVWGTASPWGITSWSARGAVATLAPSTSTSGFSAQEQELGVDILFNGDYRMTAAKSFALVKGFAALNQGIYHRMITIPGTYKARPGYGIGIQRWVKRANKIAHLHELEQVTKDQLSFDRRIRSVEKVFVAEFEGDEPGVKLGFTIFAGGTSIEFQPLLFTQNGVQSA